MPNQAYLSYHQDRWWWLGRDGVIEAYDDRQIAQVLKDEGTAICIGASRLARRLDAENIILIDIAQLWIFVYPDQAMPKTLDAYLSTLDLLPIEGAEQALMAIQACVRALMERIRLLADQDQVKRLCAFMCSASWVFGPAVAQNLAMDTIELAALGEDNAALSIFAHIEKWQDEPAGAGDLGRGITEDEAVSALASALPDTPELRPSQVAYSRAVQKMFVASPPTAPDYADIHLLQAGTGIGKTLGYVAPAGLWAARNAEPVWVSTYTRHLQDQIVREASRILSKPEVVLLKGKENYLCLLNYEDILATTMGMTPEMRITLGLLARWLMSTQNGIMVGADFPLWLEENMEKSLWHQLRLKQGECIYSACPFFRQCFIETDRRKAARAKLVVANHALSLHLASSGVLSSSRLIIDEAHHLFDATDSATRLRLGISEVLELRRWLLGEATSGRQRRSRRGLRKRLEGIVLEDAAMAAMIQFEQSAEIFPSHEGIAARIIDNSPLTVFERFFCALYERMEAHHRGLDNPMGFAVELPVGDEIDQPLLEVAVHLLMALQKLVKALKLLIRELENMIAIAEEEGEGTERYHAIIQGIAEYPLVQIQGWIYLLSRLTRQEDDSTNETTTSPSKPEPSVIERMYYKPFSDRSAYPSLGMEMVFLDPSEILQDWMFTPPQRQVLMTSASLGNNGDFAKSRLGVHHLPNQHAVQELEFPSPFDYIEQAEFLVINDLTRDQPRAIYQAVAKFMLASGGGALALFNAIHRARACYQEIQATLKEHRLSLFSQHDDTLGNMAIAEAMRLDEDSSLIATDAFRDGVDIPGQALRLVMLERLPWQRPEIIHSHRKNHFGRAYDQHIVQQRVKQAFGRLIRTRNDWGTFVLLDARLPSYVADALPISPQYVNLIEAAERIDAQNQSRRA